MCNKNNWPVFEAAEDSSLLAEWLKAANTGEQMHALMHEEFNQGFIMGRILTMMEQQFELNDEEAKDDQK